MYAVSFDRVQHLVRVPVRLGPASHRFLVDTGIGLTIVSSAIAARPDVVPMGETFGGQRMSGQTVEVPLVRLPQLDLAGYAVDAHVAGVADLGDADGPEGFDGIIGPGFFENHVVTTDAQAMTLTVQPRGSFAAEGFEIPLDMRQHGRASDPFTTLVLPSGREIVVEVDTGSHNLILDSRYLAECGVDTASADVETMTGTDETGFQWTRRWATITGKIYLAGAPETAQANPRVQFQDIIHDGLIGTDYLERYRFSFDITGARMVLSPPR